MGRGCANLTGVNGTRTILAITLAAILLPGCSVFQQTKRVTEAERKEEMHRTPPPLHLGAVHQVFPEKHFALLRIIGPMPAEGTVLITHPPDGATDRIGNLRVSSGQNSRSNIIAADIRSGTVIKGDRVFLYRTVAIEDEEEEKPRTEEGAEQPATGETAAESNPETAPVVPAPELPEPAALPHPEHSDIADAVLNKTDEEPNTVDTTVIPEAERMQQENPEATKLIDDVPDTIHGWE